MDQLKRFTKKITGQSDKSPAFQERHLDQGGGLYRDHMNAKQQAFPSSFTHLNRTGAAHNPNMNQSAMFGALPKGQSESYAHVHGQQKKYFQGPPYGQTATDQTAFGGGGQPQYLGASDFGAKNRSNTVHTSQPTEAMGGSNFNQLNKNYYIQNSTVQINTGSGRNQPGSSSFTAPQAKPPMHQGQLTKIKRTLSKNLGGFGQGKDSNRSSSKAGKRPGGTAQHYYESAKNLEDQFQNVDVTNIVYNPQQSLRSQQQNMNINFSQRMGRQEAQPLSVHYQSNSNYSNNAGSNRLGALASGGDDFLGPPTSLRSQTNKHMQKIAYLEKQNEVLQEQVSQLQQSLEINKQIQATILDASGGPQASQSNRRASVIHTGGEKDPAPARETEQGGALEELKKVLIQKNQQLDADLQKSRKEQNELQSKILLLEQVNKGIIDQQLEHSQEQSDSIAGLKALLQSYEYAMDMRESFFTKLQRLALQIAKKQPSGPFINEMQDLLIQKQGEEHAIGQQIQLQKASSNQMPTNIADLTDEGLAASIIKPQLSLKNVIFQRDNLHEKLKYAMQELETLRSQKNQLQMQLQTFDDDEDYEKMYENFAKMDHKNDRLSIGANETVPDTDAVIQQLDELLKRPKGKTMDPQMLDDEEEDGAGPKAAPASKPKFSLALGGLQVGGKPSKVPNLDFSNLKHVKENDWYAQCKKLEDVIAKLRSRVDAYEAEKSDIVSNNQAQEKLLRQLQRQIVNLRDSNERLLTENQKLLEQIKDHESKQKSEELKGQEQLLEILKNQSPGSDGKAPEQEAEKKSGENQAADQEELEDQDVETPVSSEEDAREKTVIFADVLGEPEALQMPDKEENLKLKSEMPAIAKEPEPKRASAISQSSPSDHQSNIKADPELGVPSANVAIATKLLESGIASHENEEEFGAQEVTATHAVAVQQLEPDDNRPTIYQKDLDSIAKKKKEEGELSSSESAEENQEGLGAKGSVQGGMIQRAGPRDSEITAQDQRVSQVIHQGANEVEMKSEEEV